MLKPFLIVCSILLIGCATIPEPILIPETSSGNMPPPSNWNTILLVDPVLQYKNLKTDEDVPEEKQGFKGYPQKVIKETLIHTSELLTQRNYKIYQSDVLPPDQLIDLKKILSEFIKNPEILISHRQIKDIYLPIFQKLNTLTGADAVLFLQCRKLYVRQGS